MEYILNRGQSMGWQSDPPAIIHPNIIFGSGQALTKKFASDRRITHVINCAQDEDSPSWFKEEYPERYVCINAIDSLNTDITLSYPLFEKTMIKFLMDKSSDVIYVHCQCGINRSGFLILLYACLRFGFGLTNTIKSIIKQRPCALTNPAFKIQVAEYIKKHR